MQRGPNVRAKPQSTAAAAVQQPGTSKVPKAGAATTPVASPSTSQVAPVVRSNLRELNAGRSQRRVQLADDDVVDGMLVPRESEVMAKELREIRAIVDTMEARHRAELVEAKLEIARLAAIVNSGPVDRRFRLTELELEELATAPPPAPPLPPVTEPGNGKIYRKIVLETSTVSKNPLRLMECYKVDARLAVVRRQLIEASPEPVNICRHIGVNDALRALPSATTALKEQAALREDQEEAKLKAFDELCDARLKKRPPTPQFYMGVTYEASNFENQRKLPLYQPEWRSFTVTDWDTATTCMGKVKAAIDIFSPDMNPMTPGTEVTMHYERYLYGRLRMDALFQQRNNKLLMTLRNKAVRYVGEFACGHLRPDHVADMIEMTVQAVYVGNKADFQRAQKMQHPSLLKRVEAYNKCVA